MKLLNQIFITGYFAISLLSPNFINAQKPNDQSALSSTIAKIKNATELKEKWEKISQQKIKSALEKEQFPIINPMTEEKSLDPRNIISIRLNTLNELLEQTAVQTIVEELNRVRRVKFNSAANLQQYDDFLAMALVEHLLKKKDKKSLVYLLSGNIPFAVGNSSIELFLALDSINNLEVPFEAFSKSRNKETRKNIKQILLNAFINICESCRTELGKEDSSENLKVSHNWFKRNKNKLKINPYYTPNAEPNTLRYGLFHFKNSC